MFLPPFLFVWHLVLLSKRNYRAFVLADQSLTAFGLRSSGLSWMELRFYQLKISTLEQALPKLLMLTIKRDKRAIVRFGGEPRLAVFDDLLWTFDDRVFLPHGKLGQETDSMQPVILTTEAKIAPNKPDFIFWVDGFNPSVTPLDPFSTEQAERVSIIFSAQDEEQLSLARSFFRQALDHTEYKPSYWQENSNGVWVDVPTTTAQ